MVTDSFIILKDDTMSADTGEMPCGDNIFNMRESASQIKMLASERNAQSVFLEVKKMTEVMYE